MKNIDKLKKIKYTISRKKGKSISQSLKDAGYSDASAEGKNSALSIVKVCDAKIAEEFKLTDLTADKVIKDLERLLSKADAKRDYATCRSILELQGKYLALWVDKQEIDSKGSLEVTQKQAINDYITNRLKEIQQ